ncbi:MAG: hypothetical protein AUJ12_06645 [Alphaproteobacteria bacterium CG1_02_46_17]|nr:MAG: hypothetical protein AUJ12_06645 [Alphaproteobacteria bacterium CG1_02_46_17]
MPRFIRGIHSFQMDHPNKSGDDGISEVPRVFQPLAMTSKNNLSVNSVCSLWPLREGISLDWPRFMHMKVVHAKSAKNSSLRATAKQSRRIWIILESAVQIRGMTLAF